MPRPTSRELLSAVVLTLIAATVSALAFTNHHAAALSTLALGFMMLGVMLLLSNRARRADERRSKAIASKRGKAIRAQLTALSAQGSGLRSQLKTTATELQELSSEWRSIRVAQRVHTHSIGAMRKQGSEQHEQVAALARQVELALNTYGAGMERLESSLARLTETVTQRVDLLEQEVAQLADPHDNTELSVRDPQAQPCPPTGRTTRQLEPAAH